MRSQARAHGDPLPIAQSIGRPVDTAYVGPVGGKGAVLLEAIANLTGGTFYNMAEKFDARRFLESAGKQFLLEE